MQFEEVITPRLILRKLTPEVYRYVFSHYTDEELLRFFALQDQQQLGQEKEKYAKGMATYNRSFVIFQLLDKESRTCIGTCSFHTWYTEHRRAEIGYMISDETYKGTGLMSEALEAVIRYGFERMDLNRIEAFVGTQNVPSLKLIAKNGFTKEGHLRSHYCKNGIIEDSLVFSLLKEEYMAKQD